MNWIKIGKVGNEQYYDLDRIDWVRDRRTTCKDSALRFGGEVMKVSF